MTFLQHPVELVEIANVLPELAAFTLCCLVVAVGVTTLLDLLTKSKG